MLTETIPLVTGTDGVMRMRGTRVTLETVVAAFAEGATPEEIVQQYSSVSLADVYQVVGYYLQHSAELAPYLERRREELCQMRSLNEARYPAAGVRERLLARRQG